MRVFDLEINGKQYKACCGLRVLGKLQKKYGSLKEFEKKIAPFAQEEMENDGTSQDMQEDNVDIEAVINTAELFLDEGAAATGMESGAGQVAFISGSPLLLAAQLFDIYVESMMPENEEPEKN